MAWMTENLECYFVSCFYSVCDPYAVVAGTAFFWLWHQSLHKSVHLTLGK